MKILKFTLMNWSKLLVLALALWFAPMALAQDTTTASQDSVAEPSETTAPTGVFAAAQEPNNSQERLEIYLVPLNASELAEVAQVWQGHLRASLERSADLNIALQDVDGDGGDGLRTQLSKESENAKIIQGNYETVLNSWLNKGGLPEELKPHQDYISALTAASVRTMDVKTLALMVSDWVFSVEGGLGLLAKVVGLILAIWVMMFVARFVRKMLQRGLNKVPNLSKLLQSFILTAVYWVTFAVGIMFVLALFGVNVTPLFAVFGGLSFILGFALQDTLGNLASGLMIMVLKPFDTGDYIQIGGTSGFVDEMSVVSTNIRTVDNQIIVVPNSKIWGDVITNVSAAETRRVDLVFGIGYSDSAPKAIELLLEMIKQNDLCLDQPEPEVFVGELGDSSVNIFCRPWVNSEDYWTVYWGLTGLAKETFDAEEISIPFPQRDVHLFQQPPVDSSA